MKYLRFLQSGHFHYWLAVLFFCLYRFLEAGLSGLFFCAGFFSLAYALLRFLLDDYTLDVAAKLAVQHQLKDLGMLIRAEVEEISSSDEKLRKESSLDREKINPGTSE
jgi:hypothetical protein